MDDSSGEDTRKKRDNAQVHYDHEEKPKKVQKAGHDNLDTGGAIIAAVTATTTIAATTNTRDDNNASKYASIRLSPPKRRAPALASSPALDATTTTSSAGGSGQVSIETTSLTAEEQQKSPGQLTTQRPTNNNNTSVRGTGEKEIWDLESAILYLVRLNSSNGDNIMKNVANDDHQLGQQQDNQQNKNKTETAVDNREYLTSEKDSWITFRMAHAGDAATIASWYQIKSDQLQSALKQNASEDEKPEIDTKPVAVADNEEESNEASPSLLEHWLAEGLGDEVTCPSVYGLLAYLNSNSNDNDGNSTSGTHSDVPSKSNSTKAGVQSPSNRLRSVSSNMAAVVLLTLAWTSNERHLRVEWMGIDPNLPSCVALAVQQKMWLRISTLSVMTACPVIAVDEKLLVDASEGSKKASGRQDEKKGSCSTSERIIPRAE